MTQPRLKKDKYRDAVRALAVQDLQLLLGVEPHLAKGFKALSKRAGSTELRTFCEEGVTYTLRREGRIKKALKKLDTPLVSRPSTGLDGLIKDAKRAAARSKSAQTDVAILATIERISHFGLAAYAEVVNSLLGTAHSFTRIHRDGDVHYSARCICGSPDDSCQCSAGR